MSWDFTPDFSHHETLPGFLVHALQPVLYVLLRIPEDIRMESSPNMGLGWPAKFRETKFREMFREMFREIFISHFAKFSNDFREISRNFTKQNIWKFREILRKWSYKTV